MRKALLFAPIVLIGCLPPATTLPQTYSFEPQPAVTATVTGDFNGDGIVDLLTQSIDARGEIMVLMGLGDGRFGPGIATSVSRESRVPTVADFNGDKRADILLVDPATMSLVVLIGNGDGSFQQPRSIPVGNAPASALAVDLNADGKQDIVLVSGRIASSLPGNGRLLVMMGHGDGTFDAAHSQILGGDPLMVSTADFNNDGRPDLAVLDVGSLGAKAIVLTGRGDGWFDESYRFRGSFDPSGIRSVDLNNDKLADLVLGSSDAVSIYVNQGDGTFAHSKDLYTEGGRSVAIADFDHDGFLDFVAPHRFLHGSADGHYKAFGLPHRDYDDSFMATADLNGDGWPDLVKTDRAHAEIVIALNRGAH